VSEALAALAVALLVAAVQLVREWTDRRKHRSGERRTRRSDH
jgi:hypothetical protein